MLLPVLLCALSLVSGALADCVWYGECGINQDNGKTIPCYYNGTASEYYLYVLHQEDKSYA